MNRNQDFYWYDINLKACFVLSSGNALFNFVWDVTEYQNLITYYF